MLMLILMMMLMLMLMLMVLLLMSMPMLMLMMTLMMMLKMVVMMIWMLNPFWRSYAQANVSLWRAADVAGQASGSRARSAHRPGQKECLYTKCWEASRPLGSGYAPAAKCCKNAVPARCPLGARSVPARCPL